MATSLLSAVMLVCGAAAVLLAFEFLGRPPTQPQAGRLLRAHRFFGYLFILIYLILLVGMSGRFAWARSFSGQADIHVTLALAATVLLLVKWSAARRFKKFAAYFFPLGVSILVLTIAFVGIVAGGFLGARAKAASVAQPQPPSAGIPAGGGFAEMLPEEERRFIRLCGACHSIGQVFYSVRNDATAEKWPAIVKAMQQKTDQISDEDAKAIVAYLQQFYP